MFGNDDFFNEIERAFFGGSRRNGNNVLEKQNGMQDSNVYSSNVSADYEKIDSSKGYFIVINFFERINEKDLVISVEDDPTENKSWLSSNEKSLSIVNQNKNNSFLNIKIPKKVAKKKLRYTLKNGILEVRF